MRGKRFLFALTAVLAAATIGCPFFDPPNAGISDPGGLQELVEASPSRALAPRFVMSGEHLTLTVRGIHPDSCTNFERFESAPWSRGSDVEVSAWAARPLGGCSDEGGAWVSMLTISGLPHGERGIRVGGRETARATVLSADPNLCGEPVPIEIREVVLPPAPHALGSAVLQVEVRHPTPCHGPPIVNHELVQGEIHLWAEASPCGPIGDAEACPPWNLARAVSVDVGPLEPGRRLVIFGESERSMTVAESSQCTISRMLVDSLFAPAMVDGGAPLKLSIRGRLPSSCSAVDATRWSIQEDELVVQVDVRDCERSCQDWTQTVDVELETGLLGLPPGRWSVRSGEERALGTVFVAPSGACSYRQIPAQAVGAVLSTSGLYTDLSQQNLTERQPMDVHVLGVLPDGCWSEPRLEAVEEGSGRIELRTLALWCDLGCDTTEDGEPRLDPTYWNGGDDPQPPGDGGGDEEDPIISAFDGPRAFSAGWSRPGGLPKGSYQLVIDGVSQGSIEVD